MKKFTYKARDKDGKTITGSVEASNPHAAAKLLRDKGYLVVSLKPAGNIFVDLLKKVRQSTGRGDVTNFTRQLATMINAGLPIIQALSILRLQAKPSFAAIVTQLLADIEGGESFSKSLSRFPKIFSPTYIALIRAGETGGVLDKVVVRLADNLEKDQEFRSKVKGAMIYPIIIVVGMLMVAVIMLIFVIPKMTDLYSELGAELPLPTAILISISSFAVNYWFIVAALIIVLIWGFITYRKTNPGRRKTDELVFKIPLIGPLQKKVTLTELTRTLALMVGAGVPILEGLRITAGVVKNTVVSSAMLDVAVQVEKGFPLAYSFAKHPEAFPYILSQMIAVGEETGKIEEVLTKVSRVFEVESEQRVKTLTSAIEPIIMILLGIGVAFLVIAVILPIYSLTTQF